MDKWIALVKASMEDRKVTQEQLAERLGKTQGAVAHWLNKRRTPKPQDMNRVLEALGLGFLEVAMVIREKEVQGDEDQASSAGAYNPYYRYPVSDWKQACEIREERPVYGKQRYELTDYSAHGEAFWLEVVGNAMTAPSGLSIGEGMLILVDPAIDAQPGSLVVAQWSQSAQATFRQLSEESGQLYLVPLNPTYPKALFSDDCRIIGVVVQATAKF